MLSVTPLRLNRDPVGVLFNSEALSAAHGLATRGDARGSIDRGFEPRPPLEPGARRSPPTQAGLR
jgi:hypothetical protein